VQGKGNKYQIRKEKIKINKGNQTELKNLSIRKFNFCKNIKEIKNKIKIWREVNGAGGEKTKLLI